MLESYPSSLALARDIQLQLGGRALTPAVAKLYSQHTRLTAGRTGVNFWRQGEASERLADAALLIDASLEKRMPKIAIGMLACVVPGKSWNG